MVGNHMLFVIDYARYTKKSTIGNKDSSDTTEKSQHLSMQNLDIALDKSLATKKACDVLSEKLSLSPREKEILILIAKEYLANQIHTALFISPYTVKSHKYNIYRKANINSSDELLELIDAEIDAIASPCTE